MLGSPRFLEVLLSTSSLEVRAIGEAAVVRLAPQDLDGQEGHRDRRPRR